MTTPQLIPHALLHKELGVIVTLDKLAGMTEDTRRAWKEAPTEILYRIDGDDSGQLSFDFESEPLDQPEVDL